MRYKELIRAGRAHLEKYPGYGPVTNPVTMFPLGARWMYDRLAELDEKNCQPFDGKINYNLYGSLKYGICLSGFVPVIGWFSKYGWPALPLSVLLFYILEIHFLFLFPLLIDHSKRPIRTGMCLAFKIGILRCLCRLSPSLSLW